MSGTLSLKPKRKCPARFDASKLGEPEATRKNPIRVDDLYPCEQQLIRSFRRWVSGEAYWAHAWNDVAMHFGGATGKSVMHGLVRLIGCMRGTAERQILHHAPCCPCLAPDELRLINLIGAAAEGNENRARALAADLLLLGNWRGPSDDARCIGVADAACALARTMALSGNAPVYREGLRYTLKAEAADALAGGPSSRMLS